MSAEAEIREIVDRETRAWDHHDAADGTEMHWRGRACKVYARVGAEWKLTMHTGLLAY